MAVFKLLATSARTQIIASGCLILYDGLVVVFAGVLYFRLSATIELFVFGGKVLGHFLLSGSCFLYVLRSLYGNLSAHKGRYRFVVDAIHHLVEQLYAFEFKYEKRVFLFVRSVLNRLLEFIEFAEVFFLCIVDVVKQDGLFKVVNHFLRLRGVSLFKVGANVVNQFAVGDGHKDVFVHLSLIFVHLLDNGHSHFSKAVGFATESLDNSLECLFVKVVALHTFELSFSKRNFDGKNFDESITASFVIVLIDNVDYAVPTTYWQCPYLHVRPSKHDGAFRR